MDFTLSVQPASTSYQYDDANRLTNVNDAAYTWDANGNLLNDGTNTYSYDSANRLKAVSGGQSAVSYTYDGLGNRLQQAANGNTITYVNDLNAGLTQVLSDGTNTYLYGVDRIAQLPANNPQKADYFLGDALGSVRQMADETSAVIYAASYDPFGNVNASAGNGSSMFGYTGEQQDANGMVYLRARYYGPYLNQFIQPDPIVPNYAEPQSLNLYSYVRNNPIKYTDPSGLTPYELPDPIKSTKNERDLTWWFFKELTTNVNSYYVQRIRTLLSGSIQEKSNAVNGWINLVKDSAKWDFKHNINREMGKAITFFDNNEGYRWYEYSVPGNIFYGYIGSAAGFSGLMLHAGASLAEVTDPAHSKKEIFGSEIEACCPCPKESLLCKAALCGYYNPLWIGGGFDDPTDFNGVQFGVDLYNNYHEGLTFSQLIDEFTRKGSKLAHPASVPSYNWINPNPGWPYDPGRFNGDDDVANEPEVQRYLK